MKDAWTMIAIGTVAVLLAACDDSDGISSNGDENVKSQISNLDADISKLSDRVDKLERKVREQGDELDDLRSRVRNPL